MLISFLNNRKDITKCYNSFCKRLTLVPLAIGMGYDPLTWQHWDAAMAIIVMAALGYSHGNGCSHGNGKIWDWQVRWGSEWCHINIAWKDTREAHSASIHNEPLNVHDQSLISTLKFTMQLSCPVGRQDMIAKNQVNMTPLSDNSHIFMPPNKA